MNSYRRFGTKNIHNARIHIHPGLVSIFKSSGQHYIYFIKERFVVLLRGRSVDFDCDGIYSLIMRLMQKYILDHFIERSHWKYFSCTVCQYFLQSRAILLYRHWILFQHTLPF
jgi:hypothetical protein